MGTGRREADRRDARGFLTLGGGVVLAISVFLPWYALTLTASGAATAQQNINSVARQFGNSSLQSLATDLGNSFSSVVGHQLGTVSAHQAFKIISVVLLILAAIAIVVTMARLVGSGSPQPRGLLAGIGSIAIACVVFRMVVRPGTDGGIVALSLSWGAWLALASSVAIVVGDVWPGPAEPVELAPPPDLPRLSTPPLPPGWS